jgi:predicted dehydrogenase
VTEHVYLRPLRYKAAYLRAPEHLRFPHFQVCLDTAEDLALLNCLHAELAANCSSPFGVDAMTGWLRTHPERAAINRATRKRSYSAAIVGLGRVSWGEFQTNRFWSHIGAIDHIPDLDLEAVVDVDPVRLADVLAQRPGLRGYASIDKMLDSVDPDVIYVCTPTSDHLSTLRKVLERSKAALIVCEKPISDRLEGVDRIVDEYSRGGRRLIVNYWTRWSDSHRRLKSALSEIGPIQSISRTYSLGLFNSGSYAIDQLRDMFGEICAVEAISSTPTIRPGDDGISAIVHFASGIPPAHLVAHDGRSGIISDFDIVGRTGRVRVTDNDAKLEVFAPPRQTGTTAFDLVRAEHFSDMTPFLGLAQSVVNALRFGREPPLTTRDAVRAVELCDALRRSLALGNTRIEL